MSSPTRLHLILLGLAYFLTVGLAYGNDPDCAAALVTALGSKVSYPNSTVYGESIAGYSSVFNSELSPAAVVQPTCAEDVVTVINTLKPYHDTRSCKLAIRAEGQQSTPGASNIAGGITLDLSSLSQVTVYQDNNSVSIGAGAFWGDVYDALVPLGLAVSGGRPAKGGIGGLALAGGISLFSNRKSFISDNVLNFQVVLANGQIVDANAHSNTDLWLALRGGSNNFGVVTRFDMETFAQGDFLFCGATYDGSAFSTEVGALVNVVNGGEFNNSVFIELGLEFNGSATAGYSRLFDTDAVTQPSSLSSLSQFANSEGTVRDSLSCRADNVSSFAAEASAARPQNQQRWYSMTTTLKLNTTILQETGNAFTASISPVQSVQGLYYGIIVQPLPVALLQASETRGGNSLGLYSGDGSLAIIQLYANWESASDDNTIIANGRRFIKLINSIARGQGVDSPFRFMNYAYSGQEVIQGYGYKAGAQLRAVSKKYDPEGFFQFSVPGGFKL